MALSQALAVKVNGELAPTLEDAEKLVLSRKQASSGGLVDVSFELPLNLSLHLRDANEYLAEIVFESGDRRGVVLRHTALQNKGISFSTAGDTLCLNFKDRSHPHLDRGICWVSGGTPSSACIAFIFRTLDDIEPGKIATLISEAYEYALETVNLVLNGAERTLTR